MFQNNIIAMVRQRDKNYILNFVINISQVPNIIILGHNQCNVQHITKKLTLVLKNQLTEHIAKLYTYIIIYF